MSRKKSQHGGNLFLFLNNNNVATPKVFCHSPVAMTHEELLELESLFNHCFDELAYELKQKGMNRLTYALITEKYRSLSAEIGTQLDSIYIDEEL